MIKRNTEDTSRIFSPFSPVLLFLLITQKSAASLYTGHFWAVCHTTYCLLSNSSFLNLFDENSKFLILSAARSHSTMIRTARCCHDVNNHSGCSSLCCWPFSANVSFKSFKELLLTTVPADWKSLCEYLVCILPFNPHNTMSQILLTSFLNAQETEGLEGRSNLAKGI